MSTSMSQGIWTAAVVAMALFAVLVPAMTWCAVRVSGELDRAETRGLVRRPHRVAGGASSRDGRR